ncbi:MAG TPA: hypothetical protein DCG47_01605, partial [Spirochaetaceae bacterium]|nr:hypothetical protein [Spirochaetaceae bacterium]
MKQALVLIIAAAAQCFLSPALLAQDNGSAFDADSFFGSAASGSSVSGDAGEPAGAPGPIYLGSYERPTGLSFTGEASADLIYVITEPFSAAERTGSYRGLSGLRIDALGGDRNTAKLEASALAGMLYSDAAQEGLLSFELKKLYLSVHTPRADLSVGRMIINYGRGTAFSPV